MEATKRIDKGIKRPKRVVDRQPRALGRFLPKVPPEQREAIIKASYERLQAGDTTDTIAASYGIPGQTLRHWLLDDPKADEARRILINGELARTLDDMRTAEEPLALARGREEFRAWSWVAERRESKLYGQRTHIDIETQPLSAVDTELLGSARELLTLFKVKLAGVAPALQDQSQVIDVQSHIEEKPKS